MGKKTPKKDEPDRTPVDLVSGDVNARRMEAMKSLFPEAFAEGRVDFDKLKAEMGEAVDESPERYTFSWAGKSEAIRILQTPTRATLKPCKEESVDWDSTKNLFLEGDNLEVLKLLYKSYFGRVKMIYIDPPYNTGNDFIYPDNYADPLATYLELTGQQDAEGNLLTSNPETSGRYHSAWLSMMYPRLFLARQLLREDGVIFVSIDEHEVHNLRMVMNEIFGEECFISQIAVVNNLKGRSDRAHIATAHEYMLMYACSSFSSYGLPLDDKRLEEFNEVDEDGLRFQWRDLRKRGAADSKEDRPQMFFPIYLNDGDGSLSLEPTDKHTIKIVPMKSDESLGRWRWGKERVKDELHTLKASFVQSSGKWNILHRVYLSVDGEERTAWAGRNSVGQSISVRRMESIGQGERYEQAEWQAA